MINFPHPVWDIQTVLYFNKFCGKSLLQDTIALIFLSVDALRTAILMACTIGIWEYGKTKNDKTAKQKVIYIFISIIICLGTIEIMNAIIDSPRPIVTYENQITNPLLTQETKELWRDGWARNAKHGSFPSDTVALIATIACGIFFWNKAIGSIAILFVIITGVIPRLYFGLHYPSDMIIGFLIALLSSWIVNKIKIFTSISNELIKLNTKFPYVFGVVGFYIAYIISDKFILLRKLPLWLKSIF